MNTLMLMELSQGPSQLFMKVSLRDLGLVGMDGEFNGNLQRDAVRGAQYTEGCRCCGSKGLETEESASEGDSIVLTTATHPPKVSTTP